MLEFTRAAAGGRGGVPRRAFLRLGAVGAAACAVGRSSPAFAAPAAGFGRARRCILVFLNGGPSQLDTWDMKPAAPAEIRGELRPIASSVPGVHVSELYPRTAAQLHRLKLVRSVTHTASVHTTGVYTMLTGTLHPTPKVDQTRATPADAPHLGSIVARHRGWEDGQPPFVTLPMLFRAPPVDGIWPGQTAGFLGRNYDPLVVLGDKQSTRFTLPEVELPATLTAERLEDRRALLARLDAAARKFEEAPLAAQKDLLWQQAYSLLSGSQLAEAVKVSAEPAATRERYGPHLFGQGLLLARRLAEAGVPLVTVYWIDPTPAGPGGGEYDSHGRIYWHLRQRLAEPTDRGLSALVSDLWERGLHDDTLLVVMSEFGRSPRINADAGRDHWPEVQSILLGGAGISPGAVFGASDRHAAFPAADPITPMDLGQSLLHLLGVPADFELHDSQGRPIRASQGRVNERLIS
jgi:hypothetical protein